mmetsp:Transcript_5027/g.15686  ORF Transcript_5027/g.15686 Transcript_5027/m.15686 type:complete len:205 (+) Transcript_5027:1224-1838(+)
MSEWHSLPARAWRRRRQVPEYESEPRPVASCVCEPRTSQTCPGAHAEYTEETYAAMNQSGSSTAWSGMIGTTKPRHGSPSSEWRAHLASCLPFGRVPLSAQWRPSAHGLRYARSLPGTASYSQSRPSGRPVHLPSLEQAREKHCAGDEHASPASRRCWHLDSTQTRSRLVVAPPHIASLEQKSPSRTRLHRPETQRSGVLHVRS